MDLERGVEENRLFGRPNPEGKKVRKFEQPWQRHAAWMAARNATQKEIAEFCSVEPSTVCILFKQPWFQETVLETMRDMGQRDIMELLKAESINSFLTLVEIRDDKKAPATVRAKTALDILQQVLGKPTQRVETVGTTVSDDPVAEVARLRAENLSLEANQARMSPSREALGERTASGAIHSASS